MLQVKFVADALRKTYIPYSFKEKFAVDELKDQMDEDEAEEDEDEEVVELGDAQLKYLDEFDEFDVPNKKV